MCVVLPILSIDELTFTQDSKLLSSSVPGMLNSSANFISYVSSSISNRPLGQIVVAAKIRAI
jgi:hypothetical protein